MLLSPEVECQPVSFPTAEQLRAVERGDLHEQFPALTAAGQQITRRYLGLTAHLGTPQLLWDPADSQQLMQIEGPALTASFGEGHHLILKLDQALAAACVVALVGTPVGQEQHSLDLTTIDMAILKPYLQAVAASFARTIFHSAIHNQEFVERQKANELLVDQSAFAILVPMRLGPVSGQIGMIAPVGAWQATNSIPEPEAQRRLSLRQLEHVPIRLDAVIAGASLSLTEISTLEPGDVIPLPQGNDMAVYLRAGPSIVAAGHAGSQAERLAVRLVNAPTFKEA